MYTYTIVKRTDWANVPVLEMKNELWPREHAVSAQAQLCYDDTALYVRLQAREKNIRAFYTGVLDPVCEDSCLEFFFSPVAEDGRYFNIEVNPHGAMYLGFGENVQQLQRIVAENPAIQPIITRTCDGWVAEYVIPYTFIRLFFPAFAPVSGSSIRANCYKCGDKTEKPHWLCWAPIPEGTDTFHCPQYFGTMYFA